MAEGSGGGKGCLMAVVGVGALSVLSCGCAGVVGIFMGPSLMMDAMVEDEPLEMSHRASPESSDAIQERVAAEIRSEGRTARLTGPELTSLMQSGLDGKGRGGVSISDSVVTFDLSLNLEEKPADPDQWINIHAVGSFEMQGGLFTDAHVEAFEFSGWNLQEYLSDDAGFVRSLNQQLIQQRMQNPELDEALDAIDKAKSDGDAIEFTLTEQGLKQLGG